MSTIDQIYNWSAEFGTWTSRGYGQCGEDGVIWARARAGDRAAVVAQLRQYAKACREVTPLDLGPGRLIFVEDKPALTDKGKPVPNLVAQLADAVELLAAQIEARKVPYED